MTSNSSNNGPAVPIEEKYALDVNEAVALFNIGEKKLRQIIRENLDAGFVLQNGAKYLVKRRQFEKFLDARTAI